MSVLSDTGQARLRGQRVRGVLRDYFLKGRGKTWFYRDALLDGVRTDTLQRRRKLMYSREWVLEGGGGGPLPRWKEMDVFWKLGSGRGGDGHLTAVKKTNGF